MEISNYFGFKSPNAAEDHLKALKKGFIEILSGTSRGISLSNLNEGIPVIGLVSAGSPMLAEENVEKEFLLILSLRMALTIIFVKGDSMIDVEFLKTILLPLIKT